MRKIQCRPHPLLRASPPSCPRTPVSLEVRRGEVVGARTVPARLTLSKILSALYRPDQGGAVTWDGTDTRDLDAHATWACVAVVPQSYANWPLSARENITLGQPTEEGDDAVLAAARAAGADEVVDGLRSGLNTLLAKEWWGGQELSGGQCQRIALARAFHRPAGLLVMDEPTAALDPRAEHRIFTGLRRLAVDRTVVLVTAGDLPAAVAAEAIPLLRGNRGRRVRVVNLLDLTVLGDPMTWPRGLSDADIDHYFGRHAAVLVVTLGHPAAVWGLLAGRLRRPTEVIGWREPRGPMPQAQLTDTLGMTPAGLVRAASRLLASREAA